MPEAKEVTSNMSSQSLFARVRGKFFHYYFLAKRPMTLGVRAMVINEAENSVFLVRHTYVPGWYLPGGGVERNETFRQALAKELQEEGNIALTGDPHLFSIYFNARASIRDHVALYVVKSFDQTAPRQPDREIAESGFFPMSSLPEGTTASTKRRLDEVFNGRAIEEFW
jgi:ADP-ribose pyrophosphatase YjhB (NUDIX family)